jgi:hypothetical protein
MDKKFFFHKPKNVTNLNWTRLKYLLKRLMRNEYVPLNDKKIHYSYIDDFIEKCNKSWKYENSLNVRFQTLRLRQSLEQDKKSWDESIVEEITEIVKTDERFYFKEREDSRRFVSLEKDLEIVERDLLNLPNINDYEFVETKTKTSNEEKFKGDKGYVLRCGHDDSLTMKGKYCSNCKTNVRATTLALYMKGKEKGTYPEYPTGVERKEESAPKLVPKKIKLKCKRCTSCECNEIKKREEEQFAKISYKVKIDKLPAHEYRMKNIQCVFCRDLVCNCAEINQKERERRIKNMEFLEEAEKRMKLRDQLRKDYDNLKRKQVYEPPSTVKITKNVIKKVTKIKLGNYKFNKDKFMNYNIKVQDRTMEIIQSKRRKTKEYKNLKAKERKVEGSVEDMTLEELTKVINNYIYTETGMIANYNEQSLPYISLGRSRKVDNFHIRRSNQLIFSFLIKKIFTNRPLFVTKGYKHSEKMFERWYKIMKNEISSEDLEKNSFRHRGYIIIKYHLDQQPMDRFQETEEYFFESGVKYHKGDVEGYGGDDIEYFSD